jgi:glycosyltransferase involved in cell wall biosynthesis
LLAVKIGFVSQWWEPEPAGDITSLAQRLAAQGNEIRVVTGFPNYPGGHIYPGYGVRFRAKEQAGNVAVTRVPLYPSHNRSFFGRSANYLTFAASASTIGLPAIWRCDVAYVYHPPMTAALPVAILRSLRGVPFVLHVQDIWPDSVISSGFVPRGRAQRGVASALGKLCNATYQAAAHIVVISEGFKGILVSRGVPPSKVSVVPNWTDESRFRPEPADERTRVELGVRRSRFIVYSGNLGYFQALDIAIRAATRVAKQADIELLLIGTGQAEESLRRLIAQLDASNVRILPRRSPDSLRSVLHAADAHLVSLQDLPIFRSTIPSKTQVALACGKPVVAALRGDAADLIVRAGSGIVCPPQDVEALAKAFEQFACLPAAELARMAASGRHYYETQLSLERGTARFASILDQAANTASR